MYLTRPHVLALAAAITATLVAQCPAQEVRFVDLTKVKVRTLLRRPPSTQSPSRSRSGIDQTYSCSESNKKAFALRTTLQSLDRTSYQVGDEPIFEVTVENVDSRSVRIPISPHLADLQPEDPGKKFDYARLQLTLWIAGTKWSASTGGSVILYGAEDHPSTMLTLNPGESLRLIGEGKFRLSLDGPRVDLSPSGDPVDHAYAQASLFRTETLVTSTAIASVSHEVCLAQTRGQSIPISLTDSKP